MADILINNADWVVTMAPGREILSRASVLVSGDRIAAIGKIDASDAPSGATIIDGAGKLVMPGLIDGHVHNALHLGRGVGDEANFRESFVDRYFPFERCLTGEAVRAGSRLCQLELIRNGISSFIDPGSEFPESTAEVTLESGLRGVVALSMSDLEVSASGSLANARLRGSEQLARAESVFNRWNGQGEGRVRVWFEFRPPRNCSDAFLREVFATARRLHSRIQAHSASTRASVDASRSLWGKSDVERFADIRLLGPDVLLAHMGEVSARELDLLAESDVKIAHCPSASMHGAYGVLRGGRIPEMLDRGMAVCLGNDATGSGNFIDLVRQMYLSCCGHKESRLDARVMPPECAFEMATVNAARAMGQEFEIGSLETGKKADIAVFRCNVPELTPLVNPVAAMVYSGSGHLADTLIVDGRPVMLNGVVQTLNEIEIVAEARRTGMELLERAGLAAPLASRWPLIGVGRA